MMESISLPSVMAAAFTAMIGLIIWLIKKTFETTIPEMQRVFDAHITELRISELAVVREERQLFREQIAEERKMCREEFSALASGIKENQNISKDHIEITRQLIGQVLVNQLEVGKIASKIVTVDSNEISKYSKES